jgi:ABC-type sugar transport system ATPase subunit
LQVHRRLLETMLELKKHGAAQIIISHRLQDIFAVGDRVMMLKRGENVGERVIKKTTEREVLQIIVSGVKTKNGEGRSALVVKAKGKPAAKRDMK